MKVLKSSVLLKIGLKLVVATVLSSEGFSAQFAELCSEVWLVCSLVLLSLTCVLSLG